jgi:hypothetical protein
MCGISAIAFDSLLANSPVACLPSEAEKSKALVHIISDLLTTFSNSKNSFVDIVLKTQIAQFLEVIKRIPFQRKDEVMQGKPIPDVNLPSKTYMLSSNHNILLEQLKIDLLNRVGKDEIISYSFEEKFEGIRKGLFPVSIAIKKNDKIIGFVEDSYYRIDKESGKKYLRRAGRLKEALYSHDYPDVPFIRIHSKDIIGKNNDLWSNLCL